MRFPPSTDVLAEDISLAESLAFAVPLWIRDLSKLDARARSGVAREAAATVGTFGDVLLFRSEKHERTAMAFNHLARGLAVLAFQPGGVTFAGLHWCVAGGHYGVAADGQCGVRRCPS